MINKKTFFKSLIIISLIIIIVFAAIQIRNTLARYETATTAERDVDVAFWVVDNTFESQRLYIDDIYPRDSSFEYTFTVSNFDPGSLESELDDKIAETDLEYDLVIATTTNLPLNYEIQRNGTTYLSVLSSDLDGLYTDADGTYYREMRGGTTENPYPFSMNTIVQELDTDGNPTGDYVKTKVTDTYTLKVTFPQVNSANEAYADLMEDIKVELSARQIIGE